MSVKNDQIAVRRLSSVPAWRVALAFAIAPGVAALAMAATFGGGPSVWEKASIFALIGGYPPALILGVPAYLFLRTRVAATWLNCAMAGGIVAALPWLAIMVVSRSVALLDRSPSMPTPPSTVSGAVRRLIEDASYIGLIGLFGIIGGLVFWTVATCEPKSE